MKLSIETEYSVGDVVYKRIDDEGIPGIVTWIQIELRGENNCEQSVLVRYQCSFPDEDISCYAVELSTTPVLKLISKDEQNG